MSRTCQDDPAARATGHDRPDRLAAGSPIFTSRLLLNAAKGYQGRAR
jgi:hypothetical protein